MNVLLDRDTRLKLLNARAQSGLNPTEIIATLVDRHLEETVKAISAEGGNRIVESRQEAQ